MKIVSLSLWNVFSIIREGTDWRLIEVQLYVLKLYNFIVTGFIAPTSVAGVVALAMVDVDDTVDVSDEYCHDSVDVRRSWKSVKSGDRRSCRAAPNPPPVTVGRLPVWCVPNDGCSAVTDEPSSDRCNVIRKSATAMVFAQCASTGSGLDSRRCRGCSGADEPYKWGSCTTCRPCDPRCW